LNALYGTKLCITAEKKTDVVSLCTSGIIPSEFHQYYKSSVINQFTFSPFFSFFVFLQ
jgi:hypothetical protein